MEQAAERVAAVEWLLSGCCSMWCCYCAGRARHESAGYVVCAHLNSIFLFTAGWASMSFVKAFDENMKDKYELVLVSVSAWKMQPYCGGAAALVRWGFYGRRLLT